VFSDCDYAARYPRLPQLHAASPREESCRPNDITALEGAGTPVRLPYASAPIDATARNGLSNRLPAAQRLGE
jgi:hypothetical protein